MPWPPVDESTLTASAPLWYPRFEVDGGGSARDSHTDPALDPPRRATAWPSRVVREPSHPIRHAVRPLAPPASPISPHSCPGRARPSPHADLGCRNRTRAHGLA